MGYEAILSKSRSKSITDMTFAGGFIGQPPFTGEIAQASSCESSQACQKPLVTAGALENLALKPILRGRIATTASISVPAAVR